MTAADGVIVERSNGLPPAAKFFQKIGPFNEDTIPTGLFGNHQLSSDTWAILQVTSGSIHFQWSDPQGGGRLLEAPCSLLIPPHIPHHLGRVGPVTLLISFWR